MIAVHDSSQVGGFVIPKLTSGKRTLDSNGILYANSTTTLTTSTAFTWDGTALTVDGNLTFTGAQTIATSTGALTINTGSATSLILQTNGTTRWSITSTGILESNGAQTIQTSTGQLDIKTGGAGAIVLTPNAGSNVSVVLSTAGDFIVNTNHLYVDTSAGNVGIGTTAPGGKLEVSQGSVAVGIRTIASNGSGVNPTLQLQRSDGYSTGRIEWLDNTNAVNWRMSTHDDVANAFAIKEGTTAASTRLIILTGGNVGIGTTTPTTSTLLDLSSTTGALLVPRMTTIQRDTLTATNGMIIYNTTTATMQGYINGAWANM